MKTAKIHPKKSEVKAGHGISDREAVSLAENRDKGFIVKEPSEGPLGHSNRQR